jgi:hypothetical protein
MHYKWFLREGYRDLGFNITLEKRFSPESERQSDHHTTYPTLLVVKIFDPISFDSGEAESLDHFALRDLNV